MSIKKVYIGTDLEGVAGVVDFETQAYDTGKYYEQAKLLLTAEINAAVEGLLEQGVEDILVSDGHGPGAVHFETLHPEAKLLHGRPCAPRSVRDPIVAQYDAAMMIGQHAMCGVADGNLNHAQSSRDIEYYKLNGKFIGEIAQFALYQGALGLPLIFLSGDEAACREVRELIPEITTAAVKTGLSRLSAISLSTQKAHEIIKAGIIKAIRKQDSDPIPPLVRQGPFVLEKRFLFTETAQGAAGSPNAKLIEAKTVQLKADNIKDIIYA